MQALADIVSSAAGTVTGGIATSSPVTDIDEIVFGGQLDTFSCSSSSTPPLIGYNDGALCWGKDSIANTLSADKEHNHTDDVVSSFLCYDSLTDANNICLDESEDLLRDFVGSTAAESILLFPGQLPPQPPRLPPPKNSYVCFKPGCHGRRFASLGNLNRHQREKHGRSKRYYCKTCGKSFTRSTARNIHLEKGRCDMPEQDIDETLDEHHDNLLFEQFHLKFRRCRCRCRLNPHNAT